MGYQLRLHTEVRDWLSDLGGAEPELARLVGAAVVALLDAGATLGPPLVVPLGTVIRPTDPGDALDYTYQRLLEALQQVRRGIADVATARKRLELHADQLDQRAANLADLRHQLSVLRGEEERITTAGRRLQAKVDDFRVRKEAIKAACTVEEASRTVRGALAEVGADVSDLDVSPPVDASSGLRSAATAADEILDEISGLVRTFDNGSEPAGQGAVLPPPDLAELHPDAHEGERVGLVFVVEPPDTVALVAWTDDPGRSPDGYQEVVPMATARLVLAQTDGQPGTASEPAAFHSYDAESFLDEFFRAAKAEVRTAAAELVTRNRAITLVQARQRLGVTQAQVADRMNVHQDRVSAIERAELSAIEVRVLASYASALGGRLETIVSIGDERISLR